jgi:anti-sigma B factor antagonist
MTFLNQKIILILNYKSSIKMVLDYKITEENNIQVLVLSGELIDKNQAINLVKNIDELLIEGKNKLIIDLSDLKYMNSSGLNVLIQLLTKTRTNGGESVIFNVSKKVNDLLVITKLNTLFKVADSKESAIKMLA